MTLNAAHGRGQAFHQSSLARPEITTNLQAVAEVLRRERPSLVALQELDGPSSWSGGLEHVELLLNGSGLCHAQRGAHVNNIMLGGERITYGTAIMSASSIVNACSQRFGTSPIDTKGFVIATVPVPEWGEGVVVDVVSVHLDFLLPSVREAQLLQLARVLYPRSRPLIVLGDFNCGWSGCVQSFAEMVGLQAFEPEDDQTGTFPVLDPVRRIDWILASTDLEFVSYQVLDDAVSDHRAVVAKVRPAASLKTSSPLSIAQRYTGLQCEEWSP